MALTAEDVLNKTFTQTQFRRGYDEREVDDFLDEVVAEMRRMVKDSEDLRGQLEECRAGGGSARVGGAGVGGDAELSRLRAEYHDLQAKYRQVQDRLATESETRSARERELADLRDRLRRADEARVQAGADADAEGHQRPRRGGGGVRTASDQGRDRPGRGCRARRPGPHPTRPG
jgi:DivIVA domain-containing protein